ncbi:hypothetical protein QCA50_016669 [Cerrena zonata]|uniref:Uncharacterized protein n=1 Tax=Cerrena zonata TaxID=2478898 RepID=A0AAW0FF03_9APHY
MDPVENETTSRQSQSTSVLTKWKSSNYEDFRHWKGKHDVPEISASGPQSYFPILPAIVFDKSTLAEKKISTASPRLTKPRFCIFPKVAMPSFLSAICLHLTRRTFAHHVDHQREAAIRPIGMIVPPGPEGFRAA